MLSDSVLTKIAKSQSTTVQRVILAWLLAKNVVVVPRPGNVEHLTDNYSAQTLKLSPKEIDEIDALDRNKPYALYCEQWNVV